LMDSKVTSSMPANFRALRFALAARGLFRHPPLLSLHVGQLTAGVQHRLRWHIGSHNERESPFSRRQPVAAISGIAASEIGRIRSVNNDQCRRYRTAYGSRAATGRRRVKLCLNGNSYLTDARPVLEEAIL
jgi:hypothetical protein